MSLLSLPAELLYKVFSPLSWQCAVKCELVCKKWLSTLRNFRVNLLTPDASVHLAIVADVDKDQVSVSCSRVWQNSINITCLVPSDTSESLMSCILLRLLNQIPTERLKFIGVTLKPEHLHILANFRKLKELSFEQVFFPDFNERNWHSLCQRAQLQELMFCDCSPPDFAVNSVLLPLMKKGEIRMLHLIDCNGVSDSTAEKLAMFSGNLELIRFCNTPSLTMRGVFLLVDRFLETGQKARLDFWTDGWDCEQFKERFVNDLDQVAFDDDMHLLIIDCHLATDFASKSRDLIVSMGSIC